jgi:hypothetical protein
LGAERRHHEGRGEERAFMADLTASARSVTHSTPLATAAVLTILLVI